MSQPINDKRKQWLWFIGLWCAGFATLFVISLIIKLIMGIA